MKFLRTPIENRLLDILNELISDVKIVKAKNDAKSYRNKTILKDKINIVQNKLNKFRALRRPTKVYTDTKVAITAENIKYERKITALIENFVDETRYFIKMSKKDIKKGRLTVENLQKILTYLGDKTWTSIDYPDTINKVQNGQSVGLAFVTYKQVKKGKLPNSNIYIYGSPNAKGEYVDVQKENVSFYEAKKNITVISLKKFLKLIEGF